ncbi:hypothetical protein MU516_14035 [Paracoccus sp. YLB-12]|uniref:Uncharacterized protein n=1 Tax=Paracoccus maritimus TaxID=2933292 RepID=A0ABT2KBT6_9RHOB|nr:hypothetical protein [Paracoccus sp. YLB-12]MCT4333982.1 hypothetical protein [Paracoccus sp. YLB-12]
MKQFATRRSVLLGLGTATFAAAAAARASAARADELGVTVEFEGGKTVPKGRLVVYLDPPAGQDEARSMAAGTRIESDGKSRKITLSLPDPTSARTSSTRQLVARLERADGWLLARGSTQIKADSHAIVTLHTVMY